MQTVYVSEISDDSDFVKRRGYLAERDSKFYSKAVPGIPILRELDSTLPFLWHNMRTWR